MQKKGVLLAAILFIIIFGIFLGYNLISIPDVAADTPNGCCANPGTIIKNGFPLEFYCAQNLGSDTCCPPDGAIYPALVGGYNATNPDFPTSQAVCQASFYSSGDCTSLAKCSPGCCYDPNSADQCSIKTQYICKQNPSTDWALGDCAPSFHNCPSQGTGPGGNTTTNVTGDVCLTHTDQPGCTATTGCFWCPLSNKCYSQCLGNCPGFSTDVVGNDSICDLDSANYPSCGQSTIICQSPEPSTCICGSALAASSEYCCALKNQRYTDAANCTQDCVLRCNENSLVSDTSFQYSGYGFASCLCGASTASFTTQANKYCCFANGVYTLADTECNPKATINGHVYDNTTSSSPKPFPGATVAVNGKSATSDSNGYYELKDIPASTDITIVVYNDSFAEQDALVNLVPGTHTMDFYLNPYVTSCDNPRALPSVNFNKQCSDNSHGIIFTWENPCRARGTYIMFQLYRNNQLLATFDGSQSGYTYTDTTFPWAAKANYTLYTTYDTMLGAGTLNSSLGLFTGYEQCIGKGQTQVCVGSQVIKCNDDCQNLTVMTCNLKAHEVCVGPDTNGLAWCVPDQECLGLGNPFGVFYTTDTCQYSGDNLNPCYYDFSNTIIDKCNKCSAATKCPDFRSQAACEDNLCGFAGKCQYLSTNPEMGKGICYWPGDKTSGSCDLCNGLLMGCDASDCRKLGSCVMKGGRCGSCTQVTSCKDYEDEVSCIGSSPFQAVTHPGCSAIFSSSYSNDSCGFGYCTWTGSKCIMDLNGDGQDDMSIIMPPVTNATLPKTVVKEGDVISFNVRIVKNGNARVTATPQTFYCITNETSCCPTTQVYGGVPAAGSYYTGANFVLNHINNSNVGQGLYKLFFYSNYEELPQTKEVVKMVQFYSDMKSPQVSWFNYTLSPSNPFYNTDLNITFRTDESATCTAKLMGTDKNPVSPLSSRIPQQYFVRYVNLTDGKYIYMIDCKDNAGNTNESIFTINIDRVTLIIGVSPDLQTIRVAQPIVARTTLGDGVKCYSYPLGSALQKANMTKISMGTYLMFTSATVPVGRGSFIYRVECIDSLTGIPDSANSIFTIDDVPPYSMLNLTPPGAQSIEINSSLWYSNESVFTILCVDPQIGSNPNFPSVFGCNGTRYCFVDDLTKTCTPSSPIFEKNPIISRLQRAKKYCYQSKDNADSSNNLELPVDCTIIRIDSLPPEKPIVVAPAYGSVNLINASFSTVDDGLVKGDKIGSGVHHFSYRIVNSTNATVQDWLESYILDNSSFNVVADGTTLKAASIYYLEVKAYDFANPYLASETTKSQNITIPCARGLKYTTCIGTTCVCNNCGDGSVDAGEECDEGAANNETGSCTPQCKNARCGDGLLFGYHVDANGHFNGHEECDLGANNGKTGYACTANCTWSSCGNSFRDQGEECDAGTNASVTGDCINCYKAFCGDSFVWSGHEVCDPKNLATKTGCSSTCTKSNSTPGVDTCKNGLKDNDETDIDCGGTCPKCGAGKRCADDGDCSSGVCNILVATQSGICASGDTCSNGKLDLGESDVDCGGNCPAKCTAGKICKVDADCDSRKCSGGKCTKALCNDTILNGDESDVDCGGSCAKCADGKKCASLSDCRSGICSSGYCAQEKDKDHNGLDDEWEAKYCPGGHCDPNADLDGDGLTNLDEFKYGTDPTKKDTDGDGWSDGAEINAGTDPLDPTSHPEGGFPWWILIVLLILILIAVGVYLAYKKSKENELSEEKPISRIPLGPSGPSIIRPAPPIRPPTTPQPARKPSFGDHSDAFSAFDAKTEQKTQIETQAAEPPKSAKDLEEGFEMPGWMKDKGGVWKRLESMNKEELGRMGKVTTDVHAELSGMYGKRLDKNLKDSLSNWVLTGMISKDNLKDIITALSKDGKLNKAVMRYIISDLIDEKKLTKTEMYGILRQLTDENLLSGNDSAEFLDYVKSLGR